MRFLSNAVQSSLSFLVAFLPLKVRWALGCALGWLWFDGIGFRRFTILKNLTIAFPKLSKAERLRLARTSTNYLCYNLFEFLMLPRANKKWLENHVVFHGLGHYQQALEKNKGVLLLSLHLGNGDVGTATIALKGLKINLISKRFKSKFLNDFWFGVRERLGANFMEPHGRNLAFDILKACKRNEGVIFVIDQFMGKPYGIQTRFFGRKTGTAYGLALFAHKTGAPVLPLYTHRDGDLKTHLTFLPPVAWEESADKDLQIQQMTQKYTDVVESLVRLHPEQWMWVHRRWKKWE